RLDRCGPSGRTGTGRRPVRARDHPEKRTAVIAIHSAFRRVHRQLRPSSPLPEIQAEFFPSVGANHSAVLERGRLRVRVSDLFVDAPREVFEALAAILLSKLYRKKLDPRHRNEYRRYLMTEEMLARSKRARAERGRRSRDRKGGGEG